MGIIPDKNNFLSAVAKSQIEQMEQEKQEYRFLERFYRTRGLKLFGYDSINDEIIEIKVETNTILELTTINGVLTAQEAADEKCTVDTNKYTYFEALNPKTARNRVNKYKEGRITQLSNLKQYNPEGINFYKK